MDPVAQVNASNPVPKPATTRRAWCNTCETFVFDGEKIPCSEKSGFTWEACGLSKVAPEEVPFTVRQKHEEAKARTAQIEANRKAWEERENSPGANSNTIPLSAHGVQELLQRPDFSDRAEETWNQLMAKDKVKAIELQVGGDHYKSMPIQPIEYIMANRIPFPEGNIIKYVTRWRSKGGIGDLEKARHMLDVLIEFERDQGTK